MIKFVIGLIALIFVALAAYVYTGKKGEEITKSAVTHSVVKEEVAETKVEKPVEVAKEVSTSVKPVIKQNTEVAVEGTSHEDQATNSENEIGKGLTLESIENADVSDEEKQIMIGEMLYYQTTHRPESEINSLSKKEIYDTIHNNMKNLK